MPRHAERRFLPFTPDQLFDLVADVERYPEFLPWCVGARVRQRAPGAITADLMIGFNLIREKFTSKVTLARPDRIDVVYLDGPLRNLQNRWRFEPAPGGCTLDFFVEFEFSSAMLNALIGTFFQEAVRRMVSAFEDRARKLYGGAASAALKPAS